MGNRVRDLARREDGQTLMEYGVILFCIVTAVAIAAMLLLGGRSAAYIHSVVTALGGALT